MFITTQNLRILLQHFALQHAIGRASGDTPPPGRRRIGPPGPEALLLRCSDRDPARRRQVKHKPGPGPGPGRCSLDTITHDSQLLSCRPAWDSRARSGRLAKKPTAPRTHGPLLGPTAPGLGPILLSVFGCAPGQHIPVVVSPRPQGRIPPRGKSWATRSVHI